MNTPSVKTVSCTFCEEPTSYLGTKMCDSCWHVKRGLDKFLSKDSGQEIARQMLLSRM